MPLTHCLWQAEAERLGVIENGYVDAHLRAAAALFGTLVQVITQPTPQCDALRFLEPWLPGAILRIGSDRPWSESESESDWIVFCFHSLTIQAEADRFSSHTVLIADYQAGEYSTYAYCQAPFAMRVGMPLPW